MDSDEQHSVTQLLVYLLPACNSDTLYRLLQFLSTVTDHAPDRLDKDGQEVSGKLVFVLVSTVKLFKWAGLS